MAIIQISKIQVRSGSLVDLPQLDEAEFGWASDSKRLFIGKTTPNENIEILTSYSNIDFSQLTGSVGNLNISNPVTGQLLAYDKTSNAWVNAGGNASDPGNPTYWSSYPVHLGNVSTLKIGGGAIGYVLETDGTGNLTWSPKGVIAANITNATKASPVVITTSADNFFTDGDQVTITNVSGMTQLNGNSYYANVLTSNTFALYTDAGLTTPLNGTGFSTYTGNGRAIASIGGSGGSGAAGGTTYSVQYNYGGVSTGDASFQWNNASQTLSITGTANVSGNINSGANVVASRLISNIATGTAPLVVTSTTEVANLFVAKSNIAGTVTTAAQPNITSTGILTSLSVSGNANVGNLGAAGIVSATGNIIGGNIVTAGIMSATGNAIYGNISTGGLITATGNVTAGNINTAGQVTATGNVTAGNLITSGVMSATGNASVLGIKTDNYYYANGVAVSFAGTYSNANVAGYLPTYTGTVGASTLTTGANTTAGTITGNWTLSSGSKLQATYADLAEYYEADQSYEPGTVLEFGGEKEVTIAEDGTTRVAGVVTTDPAYVMNTGCPGIAVAIALQGRVPVKVRGKIRKGDMMVSAGNGFARPWNNAQLGMVIGKSLENFDGVEGTIEIAVGRL